MTDTLTETARKCLDGSYAGTMDFPTIVRTLMDEGFEGYTVDYRQGISTYLHTSDRSVQLSLPSTASRVASAFDAAVIEQAVRAAQANAAGYSYAGFSETVKAAGCAGYMVSFPGKRVVYFGRTAEMHVEHFPQ